MNLPFGRLPKSLKPSIWKSLFGGGNTITTPTPSRNHTAKHTTPRQAEQPCLYPLNTSLPFERLPKALGVVYKMNIAPFLKYLKTMRKHQKGAYLALTKNTIGQVSIPTGTGKTRLQVGIHLHEMIKATKHQSPGIYVIAAHRLVLCTQLLDEFTSLAIQCGLSFDILYIGSSKYDESYLFEKYRDKGITALDCDATSTTNSSVIKEAVESAQRNKRHVIAVSTYHSFSRMKVIKDIAMCTYDEAHTTISNDFMEEILQVKDNIRKNFFFTATRRVINKEFGMNDTSFYGEVIYEVSPRRMIDVGEIVAPKFHIIRTIREDKTYDKTDSDMLFKTVRESYVEHKKEIKSISFNGDRLGAKILISASGKEELFNIYDNPNFKEYCKSNGIRTFVFTSIAQGATTNQGYRVDFEEVSRSNALRMMQSLKDEEDALLFHIDILTEGIDLPSITGVMPFRNLNPVKLLQTIGRGARLFGEDRKRLYAKEITPKEIAKFVKPYCWILLPEHFESLSNPQEIKNSLRTIFNNYETPVDEFLRDEDFTTRSDSTLAPIPEMDKSKQEAKMYDLMYAIEDIVCENFDSYMDSKGINNNTIDNFLNLLMGNSKEIVKKDDVFNCDAFIAEYVASVL